MSAKILEGPVVASTIDEFLKARTAALTADGVVPTLAILRVGENPDDISYEKSAIKRAEKVGIRVIKKVLPEDVSQKDVMSAIKELNTDSSIHGILALRPLPAHLDESLAIEAIHDGKDVDAGKTSSLMSVLAGGGDGFAPCTPQACIEILDYYGINLQGKHVVVVGRSPVVGRPLSMMLLDGNATVTVAHSRTRNLPEITRAADIVIACVGRPRMLGSEYFSEGQMVIDVGINFDSDGNMCGDVDFDAVSEIVSAITPVPRGVGSVTTSVLCKHVVEAAEKAV